MDPTGQSKTTSIIQVFKQTHNLKR